jgi:hypothetical protein
MGHQVTRRSRRRHGTSRPDGTQRERQPPAGMAAAPGLQSPPDQAGPAR